MTFDKQPEDLQNTVICHHSKDVSYGTLLDNRNCSQNSTQTGTVLTDFNGDNVPNATIKLVGE